MSDSEHREEAVFEAALKLSAAERAAFLEQACAADTQLRDRVEGLLHAFERADAFMNQPAVPAPGPAVVTSSLPTEKPGDRIGRYKLLEQIGEGGCGVVYVAEQEEPVRRRVALKVIKLGMDTKQVIARFDAERQALAIMDHANIAKVFDAGATETGRPYFVMELVRGVKITEFCDENKLSPRDASNLFIQVCRAIQHAHQKGIIHRDIKPSNILVTVNDGVPVPKVIDFGIAKATQGRLTDQTVYTAFEQFIGTPAYMSPEQAVMTSLDIDTRSDIYSLGILLYELLTGTTPFDGKELLAKGLDEMRRTIREQEPPRPSTRLSTMVENELTTAARLRHLEAPKLIHAVRGDLDWIVMKCLEKDRTRRYETANGLAGDIQRHLNNEPVLARPPSTAYRLQKLMRRNKLAFAAGTAIAASLVIGITVSIWQAVRATQAENQAKGEATRATTAEKKTAETLAQVAAERDAKELARQDAEAISEFLAEVFQSPDPTRDGRTITVAETLDKAAKKLETDLADQPERRAKLQNTLANTYSSLSLWEEAKRLRAKVWDYYVATCGPEHPDALTAMYNLAATREKWNVTLMEEVFTLRRKVLGPEHPDTLRTMSRLASLYNWPAGRKDEGLKLAEQALALSRKVLGPEHPDTFAAMYTLAYIYHGVERRDEAIPLYEQVLAYQRKAMGPKHPRTIFTMWNLGDVLRKAGRQGEGIEMMEASLKLRREVEGDQHGDVMWAMGKLPDIYEAIGQTDKALKMRQEVSAENPGDTILAMRLAASQIRLGRDADYATTVRRMLDWAKNATKADDFERVAKLACLRPFDDKPTREAVLRLARKAVEAGKDDRAGMPWYSMTLGMAEYRSAHYPEAIQALIAAEAATTELDNEQYRVQISETAAFYRAMSLFQRGQTAEARTLFTATEAGMKRFPVNATTIDAEAHHDDLILWFAYKEAKAVIQSQPAARP